MLKKFKVTNFKNFEDTMVFDFGDKREYNFNNQLIKNNIINKALIYGINGSGKTNLGLAMVDVIFHLTDTVLKRPDKYLNYLNANSTLNYAEFEYTFEFDNHEIIYLYRKQSINKLIYEKVTYNGDKLVEYNHTTNKGINNIKEIRGLKVGNLSGTLSIVKYIYANSSLGKKSPIRRLVDFATRFLWFRSTEGNEYFGYTFGYHDLSESIIKNHKLKEFEDFLHKAGLKYQLTISQIMGKDEIAVQFNNRSLLLKDIASTGTKSLWLFYHWLITMEEVSFLYLDEFDAFYHFELASLILNEVNQGSYQSIITTHNTTLMTNKYMRPDCYFVISNNTVKNLPSLTEKELRNAHNLEKLYKAGAFIE